MRSTGFLVQPLNPGRVCIITILLFYYKTQTFTPLSSFNKQQMCEHMCKLQLRQSKHDNSLYKHTNLRFYLGALACNYRCFLLPSHILEVQAEVCNFFTTEWNCNNNTCVQKRFSNTPTSVVDWTNWWHRPNSRHWSSQYCCLRLDGSLKTTGEIF